ncbi:MAG: hypothetical protein GY827_02465 [Cytophagales bacterium]|nr:hypothetical protein [Cytophagales bacterium]
MKKLFIAICGFIIGANAFAGGGWIQGKGKGYFQVGEQFLVSNQLFNDDGEIEEFRTIGNYTTSFYGELGLGKNWEVSTYIPLFVRNTLNEQVEVTTREVINEGQAVNYIGDPTLTIKYGLIQNKPFVLNLGLTLDFPLGTLDDENNLPMPTGDGEFNQILQLNGGYGRGNFYGTFGLGFNNRTGGFSDDIRFNAELGYRWKKFIFSVKLFSVNALDNGDEDNLGTASGLFSNNISYLSFGPQVAFYATEKVGILANMLTGAGGRNVLAAPSFAVGIFYDLK